MAPWREDGTQGPAGWNDDERVRRWIIGARQREGQMVPISAELFAAADLQPGEAVLDVGCGTGTTTSQAARAVGATGRVTGSDISPVMIDTARESADGRRASPGWWPTPRRTTSATAPGRRHLPVRGDVLPRSGGRLRQPGPRDATGRATGRRGVADPGPGAPVRPPVRDGGPRSWTGSVWTYEPVGIADNQCSLGSHDRVVSVLRAGRLATDRDPTDRADASTSAVRWHRRKRPRAPWTWVPSAA